MTGHTEFRSLESSALEMQLLMLQFSIKVQIKLACWFFLRQQTAVKLNIAVISTFTVNPIHHMSLQFKHTVQTIGRKPLA